MAIPIRALARLRDRAGARVRLGGGTTSISPIGTRRIGHRRAKPGSARREGSGLGHNHRDGGPEAAAVAVGIGIVALGVVRLPRRCLASNGCSVRWTSARGIRDSARTVASPADQLDAPDPLGAVKAGPVDEDGRPGVRGQAGGQLRLHSQLELRIGTPEAPVRCARRHRPNHRKQVRSGRRAGAGP